MDKVKKSFESIASDSRFVEVQKGPSCLIDLRYSGENNFMKAAAYPKDTKFFLHTDAHAMLLSAIAKLEFLSPGTKLLCFDGLRPGSAQDILWGFVENTPQEKYVANPQRGSIHSYGLAIDLSLADSDGNELDMGTAFDQFDELAEPQHEDKYIKQGLLTQEQLANRHLLREVMLESGFHMIPHEWWHFDAFPREIVMGSYQIIK